MLFVPLLIDVLVLTVRQYNMRHKISLWVKSLYTGHPSKMDISSGPKCVRFRGFHCIYIIHPKNGRNFSQVVKVRYIEGRFYFNFLTEFFGIRTKNDFIPEANVFLCIIRNALSFSLAFAETLDKYTRVITSQVLNVGWRELWLHDVLSRCLH